MRIILSSALALLLLYGCSNNSIKIKGNIKEGAGHLLYLEKVNIGRNTKLDSTTIKKNGEFSFSMKAKEDFPNFYQLRIDSSAFMLIVQPGEQVVIETSVQDFSNPNFIDGSEESIYLYELNKSLASTISAYDSLLALAEESPKSIEKYQREIRNLLIKHKQATTSFIIKNPNSLVSAAAYYQRLDKDIAFFGTPNDRFVLKNLTDSLYKRYPKSPYVKALQGSLELLNRDANLVEMEKLMEKAEILDKPDINLPDVNGNMHKLSALKGKVVLLDFWVSDSHVSLMDNRELLPIYKEYHKKGFEIYQVSLDIDKESWVNAINQQNLPWINVSSLNGVNSVAAQSYLITELPANFLINRKGEIVGKNLYGEELKKELIKLIKK